MEETQSIVIDCGTSTTKAGFAGEEMPKSLFPSLFGRLKNKKDGNGNPNSDIYIGEQVSRQCPDFLIDRPIERGIFRNFSDMERFFQFVFDDEVRLNPRKQKVLLIERAKSPRYQREKETEIMFETYEVSSFFIEQSSLLDLYASGRNSGIVIEIGEGVTTVCPFYDGYSILRSVKRQNFGGIDLNEFLEDLIQCESGFAFNTSSDRLIVKDIKEKQCYVALDYDIELQKEKEKKNNSFSSYFFNDGSELKLSIERFKCPELLFKPQLNGFEFKGVHDLLYESIMRCDINARADMLVNIICTGGSVKFNGFKERFLNEIKKLVSPRIRTKIIATDYCDISAWIGGSIMASLSTFPNIAVSSEEYKENGKDIINQKIH